MNPIFKNVLIAPNSSIETLDGYSINPGYAIPAPNPNAIVYKDPGSDKYFIEFDVFATDNYGGDFSKSKDNIRKLTDEEYRYWKRTGEYAKELQKDKKVFDSFKGYDDQKWWWVDHQYKVRVRAEYDVDASTKARYYDEMSFYGAKDAFKIGASSSSQPMTIPLGQ
jgi:hypothetical protein